MDSKEKEKCYTYILLMDYKFFYTGITNNLNRRIKEHRTKKTGYTSKFDKKEYLMIYKNKNRKEARKLEVMMKKLGVKGFLKSHTNGLIADNNLIKLRYLNINIELKQTENEPNDSTIVNNENV